MLRRITATATIYRAPSGVDDDGYELSESDYRTWPSEPFPVYSIQPGEVEVDDGKGRRSISSRLRLSAPVDGPRPGVDDVIDVPGFDEGGGFDVDGEVAVWDNNPILSQTLYRGIIVNLSRRRR